MPGGGGGNRDVCNVQWNATPATWGAKFGGLEHNTCHDLPPQLQAGCNWQYNWLKVRSPDVCAALRAALQLLWLLCRLLQLLGLVTSSAHGALRRRMSAPPRSPGGK